MVSQTMGKRRNLFLVEVISLYLIITQLGANLWGLVTLGDSPARMEKVGRLYQNVPGDHSIFMMIYGLVALIYFVLLIAFYIGNIKDAHRIGQLRDQGKQAPSFRETVKQLLDKGFPYLLLSLPTIGVLFLLYYRFCSWS